MSIESDNMKPLFHYLFRYNVTPFLERSLLLFIEFPVSKSTYFHLFRGYLYSIFFISGGVASVI